MQGLGRLLSVAQRVSAESRPAKEKRDIVDGCFAAGVGAFLKSAFAASLKPDAPLRRYIDPAAPRSVAARHAGRADSDAALSLRASPMPPGRGAAAVSHPPTAGRGSSKAGTFG